MELEVLGLHMSSECSFELLDTRFLYLRLLRAFHGILLSFLLSYQCWLMNL